MPSTNGLGGGGPPWYPKKPGSPAEDSRDRSSSVQEQGPTAPGEGSSTEQSPQGQGSTTQPSVRFQDVWEAAGGDPKRPSGKSQPPSAPPAPPAASPPPLPPSASADARALIRLLDDMGVKFSPELARALADLKRAEITIRATYGGGSYFKPADDPRKQYVALDINKLRKAGDKAQICGHEAEHARQSMGPLKPDVAKDSRVQYVDKGLKCEAWAIVRQLEVVRDLLNHRQPVTVPHIAPRYFEAYRNAVSAEEAKTGQRLRPSEARRVGEAAGYAVILEALENDEFTTSINGKTYREYYGEYWDEQHGR